VMSNQNSNDNPIATVGENNEWEKTTVFCLVVFILGFIFPPLWFASIIAKNTPNDRTYFWFKACMMALFLFCSLLYLGAWVTFIVFMNLYQKQGKIKVYTYYEKIRGTKVEPGEYVAMAFGPILLLVLLWEFIRSAIQIFSFKRMMRKINNLKLGQ